MHLAGAVPTPAVPGPSSLVTSGAAPAPSPPASDAAGSVPPPGTSGTPSSAVTSGRPTASTTRTVATITLNPAAVWGDGAPITAADWVATWQALGGSRTRYAVAARAGWERVASVEQGADDHAVVVTYLGADPDWTQPLAAGAARAASVGDADTFNKGWTAYQPGWFAGPYVVTHTDRTRGVLTLEPNPRWWGRAPHLATIFLRALPSEALPGAVAAGEFDRYSPGRSDSLLAKARVAPDAGVRSVPGTSGRLVQLNTSGVLADPALRQALLRGIDRRKLATDAMRPSGQEPTLWSNRLLLPQQPGYIDAAEATGLTFDAAAAAKALTDAGYPLVGRVRQGRSGPLTLTYTAWPSDQRASAEAASVTADLAALGITVRTVPAGGDLTGYDEPISAYPLRGLQARLGDVPRLAPLIAGIETELDPSLRTSQATQAARLLWQDAGAIPLYVEPDIAVVKARLVNAGPSGYATVDWAAAGFTA